MILNSDIFQSYFEQFGRDDEETVVQHVPNAAAGAWLEGAMPLFDCPDPLLKEIYYFRWWTYRKHIKKTPDGFVITEFHPSVNWAGKHNTINCAAGHHIYEGRWLRNREGFLSDYIRFWFRKDGSLRAYSTWLADAALKYGEVSGDLELLVDLLADFVADYEAWEATQRHESGLFWSFDGRDGMEYSISGPGLRPTLNSYLVANARAIAKVAQLAGKPDIQERFIKKADRLKGLIQERLWDESAGFFKVIPLESSEGQVRTGDWNRMDPDHNAREQLGYVPWYFNLPDGGYERAWSQLMDEQGFNAPFGPTTAERRHRRFMEPHKHECLWNGPSWPFATTQTLTAMANVLRNYQQDFVTRQDYLNLLLKYAQCHFHTRPDGKRVPWIDENLDPFTGRWLARHNLESLGWPISQGGRERGKDYNHSAFCDLVISGLIGIQPDTGGVFKVDPLVPDGKWSFFCLDQLHCQGRRVTVLFDRDGSHYRKEAGLNIYADGVRIAHSPTLGPLSARLDGK